MPRTTGSVAVGSAGVDVERIQAAVTELLYAIGEDPTRAGLVATPSLVAQAYSEFFSGVGVDPLIHLAEPIPDETGSELVVLRDIEFRSICEHHLLPFLGVAHIAYAPASSIAGLGRLARVVETVSSRPQLQERMTEEIADALNEGLSPRGVLVVTDAVHGCVTARGARQVRSSTVTVASRGTLSDPVQRAEAMALIGRTGEETRDA
jgi:GTP cyclohydrolase I